MADIFTWNNPNDLARLAIETFLREAEARTHRQPGMLPGGDPERTRLTIGWLRGLLDMKPSQLRE